MSTRSFSSLFMVATCAGAALGCYLVSLRVASERAQLEDVETKIVLAQRDMRLLQTEIGTRGRLSQLERWNAGAFALSAPSADQFLKGSFELARLAQPEHKVDFQAPVVLAAAPAAEAPKAPVGEPATDDAGAPTAVAETPKALLHVASLKIEEKNIGTREVPAQPVAQPLPTGSKSKDKPVTAAKPALPKSADKPGLAAAKSHGKSGAQPAGHKAAVEQVAKTQKKIVDKPAVAAAAPVTKSVRLAKTDPLAPLSATHSTKSRVSTAER
jgi:hypothetical protein